MPCTCTEARFDTTRFELEPPVEHDPADTELAAVNAMLLRENAQRDTPLMVCRDCGFPTHPGDLSWFFKSRRCDSCGMRCLDKLICRIARRHGRGKAWKLLRKLAK